MCTWVLFPHRGLKFKHSHCPGFTTCLWGGGWPPPGASWWCPPPIPPRRASCTIVHLYNTNRRGAPLCSTVPQCGLMRAHSSLQSPSEVPCPARPGRSGGPGRPGGALGHLRASAHLSGVNNPHSSSLNPPRDPGRIWQLSHPWCIMHYALCNIMHK